MYVVCNHFYNSECNCITKELKKNHLFLTHDPHFCPNPHHQDYTETGHFSVEKPVWKYHCQCPVNFEFLQDQLVKLCNHFGRKCLCTNSKLCDLCAHLLCKGGSLSPKLYFSKTNSWDLDIIQALLPYLSFPEKITKKKKNEQN